MTDTCQECTRLNRIREVADARNTAPPPMTPDVVMWVAGLFEGEGSLSSSNGRWQLALSMTDRDVIERLRVRVGAGSITIANRAPRLPVYQWRLCSRIPTIAVVEQLLPHMGERRAKRMTDALAELRRPVTQCKLHR